HGDDDGGSDRGAVYVLNLAVPAVDHCAVDSDADGLWDCEEDANTDADSDPATTPGPDTDGDTTPNYLDADDDGDGTLTSAEKADPNSDGDPRDALDSDWDGEPDYLDLPITVASDGTVAAEQKISDTVGGLTAVLDNSDQFGFSTASIGDVDGDGIVDLAVGAHRDDDGGADRGAVYVLVLNADGTVKAEQKISSTTGGLTGPLDNDDQFGISVAGIGDLDGDGIVDIAVGAFGDDDGGSARGAVYVLFLNADGTVKAEQKISSTTGGLTGPLDDGDNFGSSVAGVGDVNGDGIIDITVGAYTDDDGGSDRGAVYVLNLAAAPVDHCAVDSDSDGLWDCEEDANTDLDSDPATNPGPDTDGDTTPNYLDSDDDGDGTLTSAENADPNADGDPRDALDTDHDGQPDWLDLPITVASGGAVATEQKISDTTGGLTAALDDQDYFGTSAASIGDLDGDGIVDIAVSAYADDDGGSDRGAVYVLFLNTDGTVKAEQKISSTTGGFTGPLGNNDYFGSAIAGVGDVDGDGIADIAVGAQADDDGGTDRGAVYVLFLNTDGTVKAEQKISSTTGGFTGPLDDGDNFGRSVAGIGDVDGDGNRDIAVGAFRDDDGNADAGAAYVLLLNTDGTVKAEQKISDTAGGLTGSLGGSDFFGFSVAGVGDLDGDGIADVAIGAIEDDDGGAARGAVYVLLLNTDGTVKAEQKISSTVGGLTGPLDDYDSFGQSVAGLGDVDGDGKLDIAVGAYGDSDGGTNRGAVYVLFLNADGTVKAEQKISSTVGGFTGPLDDSDRFGGSVAGTGDLDGDGLVDIAVGAVLDDDGGSHAGSNRGAVYVLNLAVAAVDHCAVDSDSDGLWDCEEDANTDADDDPATTPGPDTDGDTTPNYLDNDDDGDGTLTSAENADPNSDGDPRDALDTDHDGQPDWLDLPITVASGGTVAAEQKISSTTGGLTGPLDDSDYFGVSAASIGDVDGDGIVDVAVGAHGDDDGGIDRGAVYVLFLNADGTVKAEQKISSTTGSLTGPLDNSDGFGKSVAGVGDVDGDGIADIAVGAYGDDDGGSARGAAYVLFLNADGTVKGEQKISSVAGGLTGPLDNDDQFGQSVTGVGDLDGDGIADIAVGANGDDDGGSNQGAVYVLFLNADGTVKAEQKISSTTGGLTGPLDDFDGFGKSVAGVGDADGDGIHDIAVSAYYDDDGGGGRGSEEVRVVNAGGSRRSPHQLS
ncbi:MAG: hypothetical protein GY925_05895, partial [Actinomycetia bacterium]|nr:hypothetical protein [Actinomycetes bacterium]